MQVNNDRALATGLTFRPIAETAKDMIAKLPDRDTSAGWRAGLDLETEAEVLKMWHAENSR
jgi:2'-hydroxyisoflavone reductase